MEQTRNFWLYSSSLLSGSLEGVGVRRNSGVAMQHPILYACPTVIAEQLAIIVQSVTCL